MTDSQVARTAERPIRIALCPGLAPNILKVAESMAPPGTELIQANVAADKDLALAVVRNADFIFGFPEGVPTAVVEAADRVQLIQMLSAGYDKMDTPLALTRGIPVAVNGGANAPSVAEHTILLILALYRHLVDKALIVRSGSWEIATAAPKPSHELTGKTVGLLGAGFIGRAVAARLRGFETNIIYFDVRRLPAEIEQEFGLTYVAFEELIRQADVISLHLPLLPDTRNIIGEVELAAMKPEAILVNTARGELIDEEALARALKKERILGAALDVTVVEPPRPDHPLRTLSNCLLTPHSAGLTQENFPRRLRNAFSNVSRVLSGETPSWLIAGSPEKR